ncbi:MAG: serine/threonine protein kinase [Myxococcota bacterium]
MMTVNTVGPYEVVQLLASGGMAEVYLGRKRGPGRFEKRVVIKRVAKKLLGDPEVETMFLDEARLHARLDHPNIVQIHDFGEDHGAYFLVMEFVAGATLRWLVDNATAVHRPIPPHHALRIVADVLAGLHAAHELCDEVSGHPLHLVHRDISPVNVLISRSGVAKLCDFGVAKSELQQVYTRVGVVKGKYRYMSPEQLSGGPLDGRSDVFAVGVCLWEMLAGRRLFDQEDEGQVIAAIRHGRPPPPSAYRPDLPRALDRILGRALEPEPERRYRSARAFQLACEELLRLLPRASNSVLLAEYLVRELDSTQDLAADRRRRSADPTEESLMGGSFAALDPGVPLTPTRIRDTEDSAYGEDRDHEEEQVAPTALARTVSMALLAPAVAMGMSAELISRAARAVAPRRPDAIQVTRTRTRREP